MFILLNIIVLWIHVFCAVLFVGGSFFMWLVIMPSSHLLAQDESTRTEIIGKIAMRFGKISAPVLVVLILSGIYNATWYLPKFNSLFDTVGGEILLVKVILVLILLLLIFAHNLYFGRKIIQFAKGKKFEELKQIRKKSRVVSYANLALMIAILVLAVMLQMPP